MLLVKELANRLLLRELVITTIMQLLGHFAMRILLANSIKNLRTSSNGNLRRVFLCCLIIGLIAPANVYSQVQADPAKEEADAAKPAKAKPANPIQNILNKLFPPRKQPVQVPQDREVQEGGPAAPDGKGVTLDSVDRRAPVDRSQNTILERAQRAADIGSWTQAIGHIDLLFRKNQDSLVLRKDGTMVSIRQEAIRILGDMPKEQRDVYARQYNGAAKRLLEEAIADDDMGKLVEVATRYFWTDSGVVAADLLGTRHLDRGEFGMASIWLKQLLDTKSNVTNSPTWQRKAFFVFKMAGQQSIADELEKQFKKQEIEDELLANATASRQPVELDEWRYLFGNVKRHAISKGSEPVMLKRWELPTTWNQPLKKKLDQLITEFSDRSIATIPVGMPLLVNGYLVARTFQGVQVADAKTGREIWATEFNRSIEGALTGANQNQNQAFRMNPNRFIRNSNSSDNTGGPLGRIMFQNAANSLLSSDGKRVFIVEDTPIFTMGQSNVFGANRNSNQNAYASNRLKAYDIETGRPLWEAGGADSIEELALPLRGCFFLGAPVPDGDDLLVVTEKNSEIHLHVLEPATGHPKWSQLLAYADQRINKDFRRRIWSTQVSVAGGTIICPTSVGWLVAVDRTRRSVLWAFRYSERKAQPKRANRGFSSYAYIRNEALNSRWATSAPIIVGDRVLYTPPEKAIDDSSSYSSTTTGGTLACVDLYSGKRIWQKPRSSALYIAGASDEHFYLVSSTTVEAYAIANKALLWKATFESSDGKPSGRGVILNDHFYQPMQQNKLLKINLTNGKIVSRLQLNEEERPLGNLTMYDGMVLSFHPAAITAFEQQHAIDEKLAKIKSGAVDDESIVFQSEVAMAHGEFKKTLELLLPLHKAKTERDRRFQVRIEENLRRAAVSQLRLSPGDQPDLMTLLEELARTPRHKLANQQLKVAALLSAGQFLPAFETLVAFTENAQSQSVTRLDQPRVETDFDTWLGGQLQDTWGELSDKHQLEQDLKLKKRFAVYIESKDQAALVRYSRIFSFHKEVKTLYHNLSQLAIAEKNTSSAMHWIRMLAAQSSDAERAALEELELDVAIDAKDWIAAARLISLIGDRDTKPNLDQQRQQVKSFKPTAVPDWGDFDLKLARSASNYSYRPAKIFENRGSGSSFLDDFRMEYGQQGYSSSTTNRINFVRESDNSLYWSVPIRGGRTTRTILDIQLTERLVVVLNKGVINCLSVPDRKVLWTRNVGDADLNISTSSYQTFQGMQLGSSFVTSSTHQQRHTKSVIPIFNSEFLCFRGRRAIHCIDVRTGKLRWKCERIVSGTKVYSTLNTVFVVAPTADNGFALRASDGRELKDHSAMPMFASGVIDNHENQVVRGARKGSGTDAVISLTAIEPDSQRFLWRHDFKGRHYFNKLGAHEVGAIDTKGVVTVLNLQTGKAQIFDAIPPKKLVGSSQRHLLQGKDYLFAILNTSGSSYSYSGDMPYMRITGNVVAYDKKTGKVAWIKPVDKLNLMLAQIRRSPILLFTHQEYDRKISIQKLTILALDKKTGRQLVEARTYSYSSFRNMSVDLKGQFIDLATYNERLRMKVIARRPETAPAKEESVEPKADDAKPKTDTAKPKAVDAKPKPVNAQPKAVDPKPKPVEVKAQAAAGA